MWERGQLKERAKSVLKGSYWKAFLVSIVMGMVSGGSSFNAGGAANADSFDTLFNNPDELFWILIIAGIIVVMALIIGTAIKVFVGYHLEVGGSRYFMQAAQGDIDVGYLGYTFQNGRYVSVIKAMFWRNLIIALWSLLTIIPILILLLSYIINPYPMMEPWKIIATTFFTLLFGIPAAIKKYAYIIVPYLLADNPNIGSNRALQLSNQMTQGHKFRIYILQLSFIGWYLLGMLGCIVGIIFVVPYERATEAELYLVLRQEAIEKGLCDYQELNLIKQVKEIE
ncbi:MAG TPA: DUF975 family protein [Epulopiscium sp.]|nr:DUF975 family protein [Candidatus Epulonipiscium sp.]